MEDAAAGDEQMLPTSAVGVGETITQKHSGKLDREDDCFSVATIVTKVCGGASDGMIDRATPPKPTAPRTATTSGQMPITHLDCRYKLTPGPSTTPLYELACQAAPPLVLLWLLGVRTDATHLPRSRTTEAPSRHEPPDHKQ